MLDFDQVTTRVYRGVAARFPGFGPGVFPARIRRSIFRAALLTGAVTVMVVGEAAGQSGGVSAPADSFAHVRHQKLACMTCHLTKSGAMLTFQPPRGCQICHHTVQARQGCIQCHEPGSVPETIAVQLAIAAGGKPARERTIAFRHERHGALQCSACHGQPVTLAPVDSAQTCTGCHADHHQAGRSCATCHRTESITQPHALPVRAHTACNACHPTAAIAPLTPTRTFCLACHDPSVNHYPDRECATCHLQASPEEYRARLLR